MKHLLLTTIAAAVLLLFGGVNEVNADPFTYLGVDGSVDEEELAIMRCNKNVTGDLIIPSSFEGKPIVIISGHAFVGCIGLTSVTIPDSITAIGYKAFEGCSSLVSVFIPDSVTIIEDAPFIDCSSLTSIEVGKGNTEYTSEDDVLFNKSKTSLIQFPAGRSGHYTISDSVTTIKPDAFSRCRKITSVTIPDSVTTIERGAFQGCSSLTGISIPESVTSIGYASFADCRSITSVTIPDSVTSIGYLAFVGLPSLTSIEVGKGNPEYTSEDGVLFDKDKTSLIQFPAGRSGHYTVPNSVNNIRGYAFFGCSSLITVTIPNTVSRINDLTFYGCSSLSKAPIVDSIEYIGSYAFYGCSSIKSVTIPNSVTAIEDNAFNGCSSVESLWIPDSVTAIYSFAFANCSSLTRVTIPKSVTEYYMAFSGCSSLMRFNVAIGNPKYASEDGVLFDKDKTHLLQFPAGRSGHYSIPNNVSAIGAYAFYGCSSLINVTIPESIDYIGMHAFNGCSSLSILIIPDNLIAPQFLGASWVFINISSLTNLEAGKGNLEYASEDGVLFNKSKTELIKFPDGKSGDYSIPNTVTRIGNYAFSNCRGLTSVTIPNSVKSIGNYAFSNCSSLTRINFEGNAPSHPNIFQGVSEKAKIIINPDATGFYKIFSGLPVFIRTNEPKILKIKELLSVVLFQRLELRVEAIGIDPLRYQWNKDGEPIAGAVSNTLVINSAKLSDAGKYSVSVVNEYGATISDEIKVTIVPPEIRLQYLINEKGQFVLKAIGPDKSKVTFQFSEDFKSWTDQFTLSLIQGSTTIRFPISSGEGDKLFYRVKLVE